MPAELVALIEGMALRRPPPRAAEVHRAVTAIAAEKGWPAPSYPVVRQIIADLDRGLVTLAHHGPAAYRDGFELVWRRESAHPNDLWQADHTELDVMIMDETGKPARPWLTVIEDDHSRAVAGYTVFLGAPSSLQTALALRQAVWRKSDPAWPVCGLGAADPQHPGCAPRSGQDRADFRHDHDRIAAHAPRAHTARQPRQTRHPADAAVVGTGRDGRPLPGGHLPPPGAPGDRADTGQAVGGRGVAAADAGVGRSVGPVAVDGGHPPQGAPRRDPLPRASVPVRDVGGARRGAGDHPLRPPRSRRDPAPFHQGAFPCRAVSPELAATSISLKDLQAARNRRRRELRRELTSRRSLVDMLTHPWAATLIPDISIFSGVLRLQSPRRRPRSGKTKTAVRQHWKDGIPL